MTAVVGIGNLLMKDEGIGVHVVHALRCRGAPPGVELIDGGTAPEAAYLAAPHDRVIVVDAAHGGSEPGAIYRATPSEIGERPGLATCHDVAAIAELAADSGREMVIIAVEPEEIGWGLDLSATLEARLDAIVDAVWQEIEPGGEDARYRAQTD
jgi:hydrogenase maturation protease